MLLRVFDLWDSNQNSEGRKLSCIIGSLDLQEIEGTQYYIDISQQILGSKKRQGGHMGFRLSHCGAFHGLHVNEIESSSTRKKDKRKPEKRMRKSLSRLVGHNTFKKPYEVGSHDILKQHQNSTLITQLKTHVAPDAVQIYRSFCITCRFSGYHPKQGDKQKLYNYLLAGESRHRMIHDGPLKNSLTDSSPVHT